MFPRGSLFRWKARSTAQGMLFHPPEGGDLAAIHVRERLRPLEPIKRLAERTRQALAPSLKLGEPGAVERSETQECEYVARVEMLGTNKPGAPVRYSIACVFGDDFYDRIDAYYVGESPRVEEYRALAADFLRNYRLNLGARRARRYHYDPPAGWQGRARGLLTQWFTYDFPKRPSQLLVAAAYPTGRTEASVTARVLLTRRMFGFRPRDAELDNFTHAHGLEAQLHHAHGKFKPTFSQSKATDLFTVVLTDRDYVYLTRMETAEPWIEADRALLLELANSIRPLPSRSVDGEKLLSWMVVD